MYVLLLLLIIPFLLLLFFVIFAALFAWSSVLKLWYSLTRKEPKSRYTSQSDYQNTNQSAHQSTTSQPRAGKQKIFTQNDGEYVDFEIVE